MIRSVPKVVLIGAAHIDRVARAVGPHRLGSSNPGTGREGVGGACFNAARALSRFGADVHLVSARGGDHSAVTISDSLNAETIADGAVTWLDRRSATYTAVLDHTGDLVSAVADMAIYDMITPRLLRRRHIRERLGKADAVLFDANLPAATLNSVAETLGGKPLFAIGVSPAKVVRLQDLLPRLAALFLAKAEAVALCEASPDVSSAELASRLSRIGLRRGVVTDGPRRVAVLNDTRITLQDPPKVDRVEDVTGAGDTLAAATLYELLAGSSFDDAVRTGLAAASIHIASDLPHGSISRCREIGKALPPSIPHLSTESMA